MKTPTNEVRRLHRSQDWLQTASYQRTPPIGRKVTKHCDTLDDIPTLTVATRAQRRQKHLHTVVDKTKKKRIVPSIPTVDEYLMA